MTPNPSIAILASGFGSNAQAILDYAKLRGTYTVAAIVSNNSKAGVRAIAEANGVPFFHLSSYTHPDQTERDRFLLQILSHYGVDLVVLAGYLKPVSLDIIGVYPNRIINLHPSLLPKYGGQGMYGMLVHQKVLANRELFSGISIHIVGTEYDDGRILAQSSLKINPEESAYDLSKRIKELELSLYPVLIEALLCPI